mmetsp:Transcript_7486/g.11105  ORF Transcript_7486/g.11105 Transcript_7486/m.11105 type:complete len:726 (+) Transcript_7486:170-2347(+)
MTTMKHHQYHDDMMMTIDSDDEIDINEEVDSDDEEVDQKQKANFKFEHKNEPYFKLKLKEEPNELFRAPIDPVDEDEVDQDEIEEVEEAEDRMVDDTEKVEIKTNFKSNDQTKAIGSHKEKLDDEEMEDYDKNYFQTPEDSDKFDTTIDFKGLHLSRPLIRAVEELGYEHPTTIQSRSIPYIMNGQDICGSAETGSGKTAAFLLPTFERLLFRNRKHRVTRMLVLLPTRELATQCFEVAKQFAEYTDIKCMLITGGASIHTQQRLLKSEKPDVIFATPGRLVDHLLNTSRFNLDAVEILIMDEADRLLEQGFTDEVHEIVKSCPIARQTLLFSATMTDSVEDLIKLSLKNPIRLAVGSRTQTASHLVQEFVRVRRKLANPMLYREAVLFTLLTCNFKDRVIVFVNRKCDARRIKMIAYLLGLKMSELHGRCSHTVRQLELERFKEGVTNFLVCTDVASRGIDIDNVHAVINFHMPLALDTYIHRVGRTARAGRSGISISLTGEENRSLFKKVMRSARKKDQVVRQRVVSSDATNYWMEKLQAMAPKIKALEQKQAELEALEAAEREIKRIENQEKHAKEIFSKGKRTWFQSTKEKLAAKKKDREAKHINKDGLALEKEEKEDTKKGKNHDQTLDLFADGSSTRKKGATKKQRKRNLTKEVLEHHGIKSLNALQSGAKRAKRRTKNDPSMDIAGKKRKRQDKKLRGKDLNVPILEPAKKKKRFNKR